MVLYDLEYLGFQYEATYGTSVISAAGSTAYKYGVLENGSSLPWARRVVLPPPIPLNQRHPTGAPLNAFYTAIGGPVIVALTDGIPLYLGFGKTTNAGAGAPYTHTLGFSVGSGAAPDAMKSLTFHRERVDSTSTLTDDRRQIQGCRPTLTRIECSAPDFDRAKLGMLICSQNFAGLTQTEPAFSLTTKPQYAAEAAALGTPDVYNWSMITTATLGGDALLAGGMVKFALSWATDIRVRAEFRHDAGTDKSYIPNRQIVGAISPVVLEIWVRQNFMRGADDITGNVGTDDLALTITRAASDTIVFTGTNAWCLGWEEEAMPDGNSPGLTHATYQLEQLSCVVTDSLAGATYYP